MKGRRMGDETRQGFHDTSRAVLRVGGEEARDWLQGLVTNDVARLAPGAPVYAALLSPQGKYLFDFILTDDGAGGVLLDLAADRAEALAKRLGMYRIRRKVTVEPAPELGVAVVWGGDAPGAPFEPDPRDPALGWRAVTADPTAALVAADAAPADPAAFEARRVAAAVPASGVELVPDDTFILEAAFERLHGVDFRKGCYVGQEVTARMHHKTTLRKGLVPVAVEGAAPPPGTEITAEDGKAAGTLFTVVEGRGLAHLRFDRAEGTMRAGEATVTRV
jgi:folate-binding protein YgfZ